MKRCFLLLVGILLSLNLSFAQGKGNQRVKNLTPEERATLMTLRMKSFLGFGADLEPKVKEVNLDIANRMQKVLESTKGPERKTQMMALQTERDQKMKSILPPDMYEKYIKKREEHKKRMENRKGKGPKSSDYTPGFEPENEIF
ncbi:MAG: hypothetical protein NZ108_08980 [Bacteroidia bacterium]|nr:hypothetical protein [Bacteroidia bacterium]